MHEAAASKEARGKWIFDLWLACYTQEEIAEAVGGSVQPVKDVIADLSANLPENLQPAASHLIDFDAPLYNVWKLQEKTPGPPETPNLRESRGKPRRRRVHSPHLDD